MRTPASASHRGWDFSLYKKGFDSALSRPYFNDGKSVPLLRMILCRVPSRLVAPSAAASEHSHRDEALDLHRRARLGRKALARHLPAATWRHVSTQIAEAAKGDKDLLEICLSLRLVLALEGVECLMTGNRRQRSARMMTLTQVDLELLKAAGDRGRNVREVKTRVTLNRLVKCGYLVARPADVESVQ
jgi:hypothetical protein